MVFIKLCHLVNCDDLQPVLIQFLSRINVSFNIIQYSTKEELRVKFQHSMFKHTHHFFINRYMYTHTFGWRHTTVYSPFAHIAKHFYYHVSTTTLCHYATPSMFLIERNTGWLTRHMHLCSFHPTTTWRYLLCSKKSGVNLLMTKVWEEGNATESMCQPSVLVNCVLSCSKSLNLFQTLHLNVFSFPTVKLAKRSWHIISYSPYLEDAKLFTLDRLIMDKNGGVLLLSFPPVSFLAEVATFLQNEIKTTSTIRKEK